MTGLRRITAADIAARTMSALKAERGIRMARRAGALATARFAEKRVPERMRPRADDSFVAGVHFAGDSGSIYQLEQWLYPLERLADRLRRDFSVREPLGILCRSADHALALEQLTELPIRFSRLSAGLASFMEKPQLRVVFYVNQAMRNFQALRFAGPAHIHLSHGESEKISMVSNQLKAYDWIFTAGEAARGRIGSTLVGLPDSRMMDVGRPQLDRPRTAPRSWRESTVATGSGPVVFVAPTWEGDSPSMAYGTITESGLSALTSLFSEGFRVIYRSHPLTGTSSESARRARAACEEYVLAHPDGFLDRTTDIDWQLNVADAAVCEMSSVAFDWLSTERPLIMIRPSAKDAEILTGGIFDRARSIESHEASEVGGILRLELKHPNRQLLRQLSEYYLGGRGEGGRDYQSKFEEATLTALSLRINGSA